MKASLDTDVMIHLYRLSCFENHLRNSYHNYF
jgi:hypothetical protein